MRLVLELLAYIVGVGVLLGSGALAVQSVVAQPDTAEVSEAARPTPAKPERSLHRASARHKTAVGIAPKTVDASVAGKSERTKRAVEQRRRNAWSAAQRRRYQSPAASGYAAAPFGGI
jgi:hypothetical protein